MVRLIYCCNKRRQVPRCAGESPLHFLKKGSGLQPRLTSFTTNGRTFIDFLLIGSPPAGVIEALERNNSFHQDEGGEDVISLNVCERKVHPTS